MELLMEIEPVRNTLQNTKFQYQIGVKMLNEEYLEMHLIHITYT